MGPGIFHVFGQVNQPHFELYVDVSIVVMLAAVKHVRNIEVSIFRAYNPSLIPPCSPDDVTLLA
jgi:hypothetical protein